MPQQQFEGRSAAEAAIKACEAFGVSRSQLRYEVKSDEGEGLERRVVIMAEADEADYGTVAPDDELPPMRSDDLHRERDGGDKRRRNDGRGRGGRGRRGESRDGRDNRDSRDGRRGRGRRGGRDGRRGRGGDNGQSSDGGIDSLLNLEAVPENVGPLRDEVQGEASDKAKRAMAHLDEVIKLAGLNLKTHLVQDDEEEIHVDIRGEHESRIIGAKGETLLSLQFLINRMVGREMGDDNTDQVVVLDAANYRSRRRDALADLATRLAKRAVEEEKVVRLSPMSAHDRRVFHLTLKEVEDVDTRSEGDGLYRNLLIIPEQFA